MGSWRGPQGWRRGGTHGFEDREEGGGEGPGCSPGEVMGRKEGSRREVSIRRLSPAGVRRGFEGVPFNCTSFPWN